MEKKSETNILLKTIVDSIEDTKGEDIRVLDLREIENIFCEYFIICNGNSTTQVNAIEGSIERKVREKTKERPWSVEGLENAQWVLMDYTNVIVHIFQKQYREFYDLDSLWGDAKEIVLTN